MTFVIGTPHTRNAGHLDVTTGGHHSRHEQADIQTCPHCQAVIDMQKWAKAPVQKFCMKCMKPTCAAEPCQECVPFIQKLEEAFEIQGKLAHFRKLAGL